MKKLKFIHTADWHSDNEPIKQKKLKDSLEQILDYCKKNKINALIHAGDVWERKQSYSQNSGVPIIIEYLREISKYVDYIFITKGNNSHDEVGSISLLHQLEHNIYAYEYPVSLAIRKGFDIPINLLKAERNQIIKDLDYIVTMFPYPMKSMFVDDKSIDLNNQDFLNKLEQIFETIAIITEPYNCPKIFSFHANIVGSKTSSGQTIMSQDILIPDSLLEKANHHYYALGHIHLRQFFKPNIGYSGSIYNKDWGEIEQKSFEEIEFEVDENIKMNTKQVMINSAKPMIKLEANFTDGKIIFNDYNEVDQAKNAEVRIKITLNENDRKLLTEQKLFQIESMFNDKPKIELNIIPIERESRTEDIMKCKTLLDEVIEYAKVINQFIYKNEVKLPQTLEQKILTIQEKGI